MDRLRRDRTTVDRSMIARFNNFAFRRGTQQPQPRQGGRSNVPQTPRPGRRGPTNAPRDRSGSPRGIRRAPSTARPPPPAARPQRAPSNARAPPPSRRQPDPSHVRPLTPPPPRRAPSSARPSPSPRHQPPPPIPRAASTHDAVFFGEGSGYLYVKTLGNGVDGSATLVRSVVNGKLYVRKEDIDWQSYDSSMDPRTRPVETTNAIKVQRVDRTYRAHGWTRWIDPDMKAFFEVTYWEHYDIGALKGLIEASRAMRIPIPEVWGALWIVAMIDTMVGVQRAGIVHNDPHHGNWLLQSNGNNIPTIILGDFGRSQKETEVSKQSFRRRATADFDLILSTIADVLGLDHNPQERRVFRPANSPVSEDLVHYLNKFAITSSTRWDSLAQLHSEVLKASENIFKLYNNPTGLSHPAAQPKTVDKLYATGGDLVEAVMEQPQAFKQWRRAQITGDRISTRSTACVQKMDQHAGEWFERMSPQDLENPKWRFYKH